MMIPLKNLDHKSFIEILQEARQNIHRFSSEWTDENYHDPGITLLEMSSWLAEMQRYYLNRVTDRNYDSLFKLMGIKRRSNGYANTVMRLRDLKEDMEIPQNMKFVAAEQVFETRRNSYYSANAIKRVFIENGDFEDMTHLNNQDGINFKLFGECVKAGNQFTILLEKPLKSGKNIQFYFDVNERYQIPMATEGSILKSFKFKCYQDLDQKTEIEIIEDGTHGFRRAGMIMIQLHEPHVLQDAHEEMGFAVVFKAVEDSWITPPEINTVFANAVHVFNQNTVADMILSESPEFEVNHELIRFKWQAQGSNDGSSWLDIDVKKVDLKMNFDIPKIHIHADYRYYRVIVFDDKQLRQLMIGEASGIANFRMRFRGDRILFDDMLLQIAEESGGCYQWYDWRYVKDLTKASPEDRIFTYDYEEEELVFGNHERGLVPARLDQNIRIAKLIKTDYDRGNVKKGHINAIYAKGYPKELSVMNIKDANGGRQPEKNADVHENAYRSFSKITRAITLDHYETLVKKAPGYRISYCKAINNHLSENQITLVVIPYNGQLRPVLNATMKSELLSFLEAYRLITTRLDIVDPVYVETSLYATIKVKNRNRFNSEALRERFYKKLTPIEGYIVDASYTIGTVPSKADIIEELLMNPDILNVDQISIEGLGLGVRRSVDGELILPENAIIYAKNIVFTIRD